MSDSNLTVGDLDVAYLIKSKLVVILKTLIKGMNNDELLALLNIHQMTLTLIKREIVIHFTCDDLFNWLNKVGYNSYTELFAKQNNGNST